MTTPLPSLEASSPRVDLPGPPPLRQDTHRGTQGSTGPVPALGWNSWAGGTPRGHRSQCVSAKRGGGWGVNWDPCPRTQTSARPFGGVLPGRCTASRAGHSSAPSEPHGGAAAPRRSRCWGLAVSRVRRVWLARERPGRAQQAARAARVVRRPLHPEPRAPTLLQPPLPPGAGRPPRIGWQCAPGRRSGLRQRPGSPSRLRQPRPACLSKTLRPLSTPAPREDAISASNHPTKQG